ncbi:MAG: LCP family protein [Oscillospiraceae bacterium]|nr:LCP family protein [Oscillospiraceae bacterium]
MRISGSRRVLALVLPVLLMLAAVPRANAVQISGQEKTEASAPLNILLIGQDSDPAQQSTRADSMILCSFNKNTEKLLMVSFLRDLYVPIPGHGSNRLNAAYAFGGAGLLKQTLEQNFDIRIDGTVEADFSQFSQIIDTLGGVDLTLRQDEADVINRKTGSTLVEGQNHLSGDQVLVFSRIRNLDADGDFSRTHRQRQVLEAVWSRYQNISLSDLLKTVRNLLPMLKTDMSNGAILSAMVRIFPSLSRVQIVSAHLPVPGSYTDQKIDTMAVLVTDLEQAGKYLRQWIETGTVT